MFSLEERNRIRDRLLEIGRADRRLVAAAFVGSSAGGGDRWSDLDLAFGLADDASLESVLTDWTTRLQSEFKAVHLFDLPFQSSLYRVFLLPGNLQVDLSFTPRVDFGAHGPKFKLLFGEATKRVQPTRPSPQHLFGLAVHHLVRARICIERGKAWQAQYWISEARNLTLSLACHNRGLQTNNARGHDDLPAEVLAPFTETLLGSLNPSQLIRALAKMVDLLLLNSQDVREVASKLEEQLRKLTDEL